MKSDPDRELVEACQASTPAGLEGAFRVLYDQYKDRVYNVCYRITGNAADATKLRTKADKVFGRLRGATA